MNKPDEWERLRAETEQIIGERLVLRPVKVSEPGFRGRLTQRPGYLLVEYRDETSGYFWDLDALREMLRYVCQGRRNLTVLDNGWQIQEETVPSETPDGRGDQE